METKYKASACWRWEGKTDMAQATLRVTKFRTLRWEDYLRLLRWAHATPRVFIRERGGQQWTLVRMMPCDKDATGHFWLEDEEANSQEMQAASRRWKKQETDYPIEYLEGTQSYLHLNFGSVKPILRLLPFGNIR